MVLGRLGSKRITIFYPKVITRREESFTTHGLYTNRHTSFTTPMYLFCSICYCLVLSYFFYLFSCTLSVWDRVLSLSPANEIIHQDLSDRKSTIKTILGLSSLLVRTFLVVIVVVFFRFWKVPYFVVHVYTTWFFLELHNVLLVPSSPHSTPVTLLVPEIVYHFSSPK